MIEFTNEELDFNYEGVKEKTKQLLKECEQVTITFTKLDGSERVLVGTLKKEKLPVIEESDKPKRQIKQNDGVIKVYDLENEGWRSVKWETIKSIKF